MKKLSEYVSGNFLKAINVTSEGDAFVITEVNEIKDKDSQGRDTERIRLTVQRNSVEYDFDLNKTNTVFLVNAGYTEPTTLVSKKIYFKKALVRSPKTNQEVEGLRICKIE